MKDSRNLLSEIEWVAMLLHHVENIGTGEDGVDVLEWLEQRQEYLLEEDSAEPTTPKDEK